MPSRQSSFIQHSVHWLLRENVKISAFADDIKLHCTEQHPLIATIKLQRACETIIEWCRSRMFYLSVEKSEMIIFSRSHNQTYDGKIILNGLSISPQETINYLGSPTKVSSVGPHWKVFNVGIPTENCVKARKVIGQIKWFTRTKKMNSRITQLSHCRRQNSRRRLTAQ